MTFALTGRTVAITGVRGFIGRHLARRCLSMGLRVRGLDLDDGGRFRLEEPDITFLAGDINNEEDVQRLCEGAGVVIHAAAVVREGGDPALFQRVNVEGTRTVARTALDHGVQRFVQISSVMVYGYRFEDGIDEQAELKGEGNPYCQTKIDSERVAMEHHETGTFDVITIRCGDVYGPGSIPWTVRPVQMMRWRIFSRVSGGRGIMSPVFIDNLVDGILLAVQSDYGGEAFNISDGVAITFRDFFNHYAQMLGGRWMPSFPGGLMKPGIRLANGMLRLVGVKPLVYPDFVDFVSRRGGYSTDKARRMLGYEPAVSLDDGMKLTQAWLAQQNLVPPPNPHPADA